jgi:DNA-binding transcriptional LysR family regulator
MLNVTWMRTLREVAARGSFSAAAQEMAFTQPAVSRQVALLERQAGTPLVARTRQGVRLTDAGRLLVGHADAIIARLDAAEEQLAELAGLRRGRVRLGAFPSALAHLAPRAVAAMRERHPGIEVSLSLVGRDEALAALRAGRLDMALIFTGADDARPPEPEVELTPLFDDRFAVVLPPDHRLAGRRRVRLRELAGDPWIQGASGGPASRLVQRACRAAGFEPRIAFETDDPLVTWGLVAAGVGVALASGFGLAAVPADVSVCSLGADSPVRRIEAATLQGLRTPAQAALLDVLGTLTRSW